MSSNDTIIILIAVLIVAYALYLAINSGGGPPRPPKIPGVDKHSTVAL